MPDNLKSLIELGKNLPSRKEFQDSFGAIATYIKGMDKRLTATMGVIHSTLSAKADRIHQDHLAAVEDIKKQVDHAFVADRLSKIEKDLHGKVDAKLATVRSGKDGKSIKGEPGKPGRPGMDANETAIHDRVVRSITPILEKHSADLTAKIPKQNIPGWGAHPIQVFDSTGKVIDDVTRNIKFTGATLTRSQDGVVTVAINAGVTVLTATETPNGTRTVFTLSAATAKPSYVVSDNVWLRATTAAGTVNWTWNSGTKQVTMTIAPADELYGIV